MKKVIIFGLGEQAELAWWFFSNDSDYDVVAFSVDEEFKDKDVFHGLPVVSTDNLSSKYPPSNFDAFVAVGYNKINRLREEKYQLLKSMGYNLASYISSKATILTEDIGDNCFLLEDNTIQPFVKIGNNVTLWSGNHIGHHSVIEDHCFITSHVVVSGGVTVGRNSFLGVNSTFRDHIKVGAYNVVGAGAIIMSDTEDEAVYIAEKTMPKKIKSSRLKGI
ncbi:MAG: acetyltransferase [Vibrio sp.]|uniref:acetyltransferase n=1 Tax=Vibrio sp. TaxID=678 RepID=UPI003F3F100C